MAAAVTVAVAVAVAVLVWLCVSHLVVCCAVAQSTKYRTLASPGGGAEWGGGRVLPSVVGARRRSPVRARRRRGRKPKRREAWSPARRREWNSDVTVPPPPKVYHYPSPAEKRRMAKMMRECVAGAGSAGCCACVWLWLCVCGCVSACLLHGRRLTPCVLLQLPKRATLEPW